MSTPIDNLIAAVNFPAKGEYFSCVCTGWPDNSYKEDVFECLASDASRVVAKRLTNAFSDKPHVFFRPDWRFDDVSGLLEALGIGQAKADESAEQS